MNKLGLLLTLMLLLLPMAFAELTVLPSGFSTETKWGGLTAMAAASETTSTGAGGAGPDEGGEETDPDHTEGDYVTMSAEAFTPPADSIIVDGFETGYGFTITNSDETSPAAASIFEVLYPSLGQTVSFDVPAIPPLGDFTVNVPFNPEAVSFEFYGMDYQFEAVIPGEAGTQSFHFVVTNYTLPSDPVMQQKFAETWHTHASAVSAAASAGMSARTFIGFVLTGVDQAYGLDAINAGLTMQQAIVGFANGLTVNQTGQFFQSMEGIHPTRQTISTFKSALDAGLTSQQAVAASLAAQYAHPTSPEVVSYFTSGLGQNIGLNTLFLGYVNGMSLDELKALSRAHPTNEGISYATEASSQGLSSDYVNAAAAAGEYVSAIGLGGMTQVKARAVAAIGAAEKMGLSAGQAVDAAIVGALVTHPTIEEISNYVSRTPTDVPAVYTAGGILTGAPPGRLNLGAGSGISPSTFKKIDDKMPQANLSFALGPIRQMADAISGDSGNSRLNFVMTTAGGENYNTGVVIAMQGANQSNFFSTVAAAFVAPIVQTLKTLRVLPSNGTPIAPYQHPEPDSVSTNGEPEGVTPPEGAENPISDGEPEGVTPPEGAENPI